MAQWAHRVSVKKNTQEQQMGWVNEIEDDSDRQCQAKCDIQIKLHH